MHEALDTVYPGERRLHALFAAALTAGQVPPTVVADTIQQIVESDAHTLRYPVGPDAIGFIQWRQNMTDEAWVAQAAVEDDETWASRIEEDFGLDVRPFLGKSPSGIVK